MYELYFSKHFNKKYKHITHKNELLKKYLHKALKLLKYDPQYPSLRTHKVDSRLHGERYSSWVTGDMRIIWDYDENDTIILILLDLGSHTGKHKVYK